MKVLSTLIAIASAGQLMKDNDGTIMNWHGPHGGHHNFFEGVPYHHGGHGGPRDDEGKAIHGHGPHGGHPQNQKVNYAEEEHHHDAVSDHGRGHGHGHHHGHGHGHGRNHRGGGGY